MLTVITPTGGREKQLKLLDKYLQRQTNQEFRWIVLDDYPIKSKKPKRCDLLIQPSWKWQDKSTQSESMIRLLQECDDRVIICEDDDYYKENHIELMNNLLDQYDLVGQKPTVYYNVKNKTYRNFYKTNHACMCQTAIKGDAINHLIDVCKENTTNLDVVLWKSYKGSKYLDETMTAIGIKGMGGRNGLGIGHKMYAEPDSKNEMLKKLIGKDIKYYL